MSSSLDPLLRPRSVAVVGASRTRGSIGAEVFHNIIANGFTGAVYPINPGAHAVQGVRAYPSLREVPDPIDLAVIVVPAARVMAVIDDSVEAGVKAVLVISALPTDEWSRHAEVCGTTPPNCTTGGLRAPMMCANRSRPGTVWLHGS